jgi:hypothetical protein
MGPSGRGLGLRWLKNRQHNRVLAKIVPRAKVARLRGRADGRRAAAVAEIAAEIVVDVPVAASEVETAGIAARGPAAASEVANAASAVSKARPRSSSTS